jgi:threonine dehydrogenase-like Zn-dependent dehydrogenase
MKALVWHGDRSLRYEEADDPGATEDQVVLDVSLTGICGSDLHGYRGHPGPRVPPLVLGHEAVGTVVGRPGRFAPFPIVACGRCAACARQEENLCATRGLLGLDRPGVFAERVAVAAASLVPIPDGLPDELAVLTEPLAVAASAARIDDVRDGMDVLVIGCGPIGLLAAHVARTRGARVTAADGVPGRRAAAEAVGVGEVLEDAFAAREAAFDLVVDAVGAEATCLAGIRAVRRGGRVTLIGLGAAEARIPLAQLVRDAVEVRGHYAYTRADFEDALRSLADTPPARAWLTSLSLEEGAEGFRRLVDEPGRYTKVLLRVAGDR